MMPSQNDQKGLQPGQLGNHIFDLVPEISELAEVKIEILDDIDSSNVTPKHWEKWLARFKSLYNKFDGFVITHGTDSMVYSSSAFSFALGQTEKPIVFTGSQRPLTHIRTDARDNLINAIEISCRGPKEVSICFGNRLLRANRAIKLSASDYVAFESFNFPHLAKIGLEIEGVAEKQAKGGKPMWHSDFKEGVFCFKIFPGLSADIIRSALQSKACEGIVLEAYGSGNVPSLEPTVLNIIEDAEALKKPVIIVSQCPHGRVDLDLYECGIKAKKAGAISGGDMTREASIVKLMHGLGLGLIGKKLANYFLEDISGERSF